MVVILPGFSGTSEEGYVMNLADNLLKNGFDLSLYLARFDGKNLAWPETTFSIWLMISTMP